MTYNTTAIATTPSLLLQRRSEVAGPAISAKDRIAMSAEATRHLAVGFLLIWAASERLIDASATDDERQGFSRDQENSGTFAANASPARQHQLRNVL
jgi:hypothetical protein